MSCRRAPLQMASFRSAAPPRFDQLDHAGIGLHAFLDGPLEIAGLRLDPFREPLGGERLARVGVDRPQGVAIVEADVIPQVRLVGEVDAVLAAGGGHGPIVQRFAVRDDPVEIEYDRLKHEGKCSGATLASTVA